MNDRIRFVAIPLLGVASSIASTSTYAQVASQRWTTSGTELKATSDSLPVAETRPVPRSEIESGLALSGRGTPFIIAPRVDGITGGLATDAVTLEA